MNLKELVKDWLVAHGYDGLYNNYDELCNNHSGGCRINDLFPCGGLNDCQPAYYRRISRKDFFTDEDWDAYPDKEEMIYSPLRKEIDTH